MHDADGGRGAAPRRVLPGAASRPRPRYVGPMPSPWKNCSSCKHPILHGQRYYRCSVSTCNSARFQLVFCSVACWDAHAPAMNHRGSAGALDARAPAEPGPATAVEPERRLVRSTVPEAEPGEVLIVASRLKDYIRDQADFNCSADVMEALSDIVRDATRDAIDQARAEGRRTVMGRDFRRG